MLHSNTIKSEVKKNFPGVQIREIKKFGFGIFSVKVEKQMPRSVKVGNLYGQTDFNKSENGVVLDAKIEWL